MDVTAFEGRMAQSERSKRRTVGIDPGAAGTPADNETTDGLQREDDSETPHSGFFVNTRRETTGQLM